MSMIKFFNVINQTHKSYNIVRYIFDDLICLAFNFHTHVRNKFYPVSNKKIKKN